MDPAFVKMEVSVDTMTCKVHLLHLSIHLGQNQTVSEG